MYLFMFASNRREEGEVLFADAFKHLSNTPSVTPLLLAKTKFYWASHISDGKQAEALHRESLSVFRQFDAKVDTTHCLINLAGALIQQGNYATALQVAQEALRAGHAAQDNWYIAVAHSRVGLVYSNMGKFEESLQHQFQSLALNEAIGDKLGVAWIHNGIAFVMMELGYMEEAYQHTLQAYQLSSQNGSKRGTAEALNTLGTLAAMQGDYETSERHYRDALAMHRDVNNRRGIAWVATNLADLLINTGRFDEAEQLLNESMHIAETLKAPNLPVGTIIGLSLVAGAKENYAEAHRLADKAYHNTLPEFDAFATSRANFCFGWALCGIGASEDALPHLAIALKLIRSYGDIPGMLNIVAALAYVIAQHSQPARASELLGMVFAHPIQLKWLGLHPLITQLRHDLQAALGEGAYTAAWERGKSLDLQTVIQQLLDEFSS